MDVGEFARIGLALLFLSAGALKLSSPVSMSQTLGALGFPPRLRFPGAIGVIVLELATGGLLLFLDTWMAGSGLVLVLIGLFAAAVGVSLSRTDKIRCSCFGGASSADLGWGTVPRLMAMLAANVVLLARGSSYELWELPYEQLGLALLCCLAVAGTYMTVTRIHTLLRA